jgi:lysophospholipase L1-like esterase
MSVKMLEGMTQAEADEFDAMGHADQRAENGKNRVDRTHLNAKGQAVFGRMVADDLVKVRPELKGDVKADVAGGALE